MTSLDLYTYDVESYPNVFTLCAIHHSSRARYAFEVSEFRDQSRELLDWLQWLASHGAHQVGFNCDGYDYPMLHHFMVGHRTPDALYQKTQSIIGSNDRFANTIWDRDKFIPQIDLFKIHHFDNKARMTSLKQLEFAMRMWSIVDLPFPVGQRLTESQIKTLIEYNMHDVEATDQFLDESMGAIEFRLALTEKFGRPCLNDNDTKIGKQHFISQLEKQGVPCYDRSGGRRKLRQTHRPHGIPLENVILPFISFDHPEFQFVHDWLKRHTVHDTRESLLVDSTEIRSAQELAAAGLTKPQIRKVLAPSPLSATIDGFQFDFGLGGLHGSIESALVVSDDEMVIIDLDVTSYYPSIAIVHRFFPEHLSERFCEIYQSVKDERLTYEKDTPENKALKLALNGTYGDSNNEYSPLFDPQYTMAITVNGQLMLAMLAERLLQISRLSMIQANTDGVTVRLPRALLGQLDLACKIWEGQTGMALERAEYTRMWIRDVNNYVAEGIKSAECPCGCGASNGKVKQKGCYTTEPEWHQDHSQLVVPKVALRYLLHGGDIEHMVRTHRDLMDFMLKVKVRRSDELMWGSQRVQSLSRFYVTDDHSGAALVKRMPLTDHQRGQVNAKIAKLEQRLVEGKKVKPDELAEAYQKRTTGYGQTSICAGRRVQVCNTMDNAVAPIGYDYYIGEVKKLVGYF